MADGISLGGSLTIDSNVIFLTGAVAIAALAGSWFFSAAAQHKERGLMSYNALSYSAQTVEQRMLQRLAMNLPAMHDQPQSVRLAIMQHRSAIRAAMLKYRQARLDYMKHLITKTELLNAASEFRATINSIMEQIMHDYNIPVQQSMYAMVTPLWRKRERLEEYIRNARR